MADKSIKLENITSVKQTTNDTEVNEYLAKGYCIIKIISSKVTIGMEEIITPCYILAMVKKE